MQEQPVYRTVDKFDRMLSSLEGQRDTTKSKPSTVVVNSPVIGVQTFIVQTVREPEKGDTVFIQYVDDGGSVRMVLPPGAVNAIIRQRDSLTTKVRKRVGKDSAAARKARGELPGFMKIKKAE